MARFTLFALLVAFFASLTQATLSQVPLSDGGPIHKTDSWTYANCGKSTSTHRCNHFIQEAALSGSPNDVVTINSIVVSPDPPQPGQNLTVTVNAYVATVVKVCTYLFTLGIPDKTFLGIK